MADEPADVDALRAELAELRATVFRLSPKVAPGWGERTCQTCGALADVIDLELPDDWPVGLQWNGEGYCQAHALDAGVLDEGHPSMLRPGPKRKSTK